MEVKESIQNLRDYIISHDKESHSTFRLLIDHVNDLSQRIRKVEEAVFYGNGSSLITRLAVVEEAIGSIKDIVRRLEHLEESGRARAFQLSISALAVLITFVLNIVVLLLRK